MTTTIHDNLPKHLSACVLPLVRKHLALVPTWCHSLTLQANGELARAACETHPEYRGAVLYICAFFMHDDDEERENTVIHELLHITLEPLCAVAHRLMPEDAERRGWAEEDLRSAVEGAVSDLMNHMGRHVRVPPDDPIEDEGGPPVMPPAKKRP